MTARPGRVEAATTGPTADAGMVTAELAVALPTLLVVLLAGVSALMSVSVQLRCTDAAATAARLVARGESPAAARVVAAGEVSPAATVSITTDAGVVTVVVRAPAPVPGVGRWLHLPAVSARFSAPLEPGAAS